MAAGQFLTTKLMRSNNQTPWGFRLQGGKEFMAPLSVVKVNVLTFFFLSTHSNLQFNQSSSRSNSQIFRSFAKALFDLQPNQNKKKRDKKSRLL